MFGQSSVVYDHASSTICIYSSAAQEGTWLMHRTDRERTTKITHSKFSPFPGDQIQCAVAVSGTVPQIVMVNHSNEVFILRFESGHWKSSLINERMRSSRGEIVKADEKMSIAAMDGAIRLFWMHGQDGQMLHIDTSGAKHEYQFEPKITTPF